MATRKPAASLLRGEVLDNVDPEGQGRVQVQVPALGAKAGTLWADVLRPALWPTGWPQPEPPAIGTAVILAWEGPAASARPVVVGAVGPVPEPAPLQPIKLPLALPVQVSAPLVTVEAPLVRCLGTLRCDTLLAENVISTTYSPGAGNQV